MTTDKKPAPVTAVLLDSVFESVGLYRRGDDPKNVDYDLGWLTDPLTRTKTSLTSIAQDPLLKLLALVLQPEPAPVQKIEGVAPIPSLPCFFRVHKDVPIGLHVRAGAPGFTAQIPGKPAPQSLTPLAIDVVAMLPKDASLDPNFAKLTPPRKPPTLLVRARVARLVTGTVVAALEQPIDLGVELRLAHKPAPGAPPSSTPPPVHLFAEVGAHVGLDSPAEVRLELADASLLRATTDAADRAARRSVTWARGASPIFPLIQFALLVVRSWVVGLCEANPRPASPPVDYKPHFAIRLRDHLFPLLEGNQAEGIPAFPLTIFKPDLGVLLPWLKSFLAAGVPGPLVSILLHLRALFTGKELGATAPGSAIAWLTDRTGPADHSAPVDQDFGLVLRTAGDETHGSVGLGLRGQKSWRAANDTVRIGLALEGELVSASWDLAAKLTPTTPKLSARARAHTGSAHLFVVVEPISPAQALFTGPTGDLVRIELGATLTTAGLFPEVRVTLGKLTPVTHSLARVLRDLKDAVVAQAKAQAEAVSDAIKAELANTLADLKTQLTALLTTIEQTVAAYTAAVTSVLPADVRDALTDLLADVKQRAPTLDPALLPGNAVDAVKAKTLLARTIAWARAEASAAAGDLVIPLGDPGKPLARLTLSADPTALTYGATLVVDPAAFPADLPLRLSSGTAIGLQNGALAFSAGLELATATGLPWQPGLRFSLANNQPRLDLDLGEGTTFPLIGGTLQPGPFIAKLVRPLLKQAVNGVDIVPGLPVADVLTALGLSASGDSWQPPDPLAVARDLLAKIATLAQSAAASQGLSFTPQNLELAVQNLSFGSGNVSAGLGKFSVALLTPQGALAPTVTLDDLKFSIVGEDDAPAFDAGIVSVGKLTATASLDVIPPKFRGVAIGLADIRLPLGSSGKGEAGLLSGGKDNPGFALDVGWTTAPPKPGFYARFPGNAPRLDLAIDRVIGPLDVRRMAVALTDKSPPEIKLTLDARFKLGGVTIAPQGLGVTIPLASLDKPATWTPTLDGLGLAYDQSGVVLAGMLAKTANGGFAGQATIKAFEFQLGALAAYDKIPPDDVASLAVFGVLRTTLGGPPFFVVTGVAAGFGVNRGFDRPRRTADLANNALLKTMQGGEPLDLAAFRASLPSKRGAFWLAGGVKFVSYGFILGDALLYVLLDDGFELGLLAVARMGIPDLLQLNLAIEAGLSLRGEPTLYAKAALYDSWLLHKDCKITGGFALQVWPRKGDAVITIGGYHPAFSRPAEYPEVERLGFNWSLGDAILIKGGCYFAMTPREAMGGGRLEVSGHWGPLSAGFHAGVDGLIRWDPFFFDVALEVGIWGAVDLWFTTLRFSIRVGLHVWGPPLGGVASIDLDVFAIDIPFGDPAPRERPYLKLAKAVRDHLHAAVPNDDITRDVVAWPAQNLAASTDASGPLRLQVSLGQDPGKPSPDRLRVASESVLRLDLAIPVTATIFNSVPEAAVPAIDPLHLALAGKAIARSLLTVRTPWARGRLRVTPEARPTALFGPPEAAAGAAATMTTRVAAVVEIDLTADRVGPQLVDKLTPELSLPAEVAPLPLASDASDILYQHRKPAGVAWTPVTLAAAAPRVAARVARSGAPLPRKHVPFLALARVRSARLYRGHIFRRQHAALAPHAVERPPQLLELAFLELPSAQTTRLARTTADPARAELPRIAPPAPVQRSPLLTGLALHHVETRTRAADPPRQPSPRPPTRTTSGKHPRTVHAPAGPARRAHLVVDPGNLAWHDPLGRPPPTSAVVRPAEVCVLDLARPDARRAFTWTLHAAGNQQLRLVALDVAHRVLADVDLAPGPQDMSLPPGTRRLALVGAGAARPAPRVLRDPRQKSLRPAPAPAPPVRGFGPDTALISLAPRVLLAAGAVLEILDGTLPQPHPLTRAAASDLLRRVERLTLRLPARDRGSLAVVLTGISGAAERVRKLECTANDLRLRPLQAHVRGDTVLLWCPCEPAVDRLEVRVPPGLRLVGLSFWTGLSAPPADALDRPIHHPVLPHQDATRFTLEVQ